MPRPAEGSALIGAPRPARPRAGVADDPAIPPRPASGVVARRLRLSRWLVALTASGLAWRSARYLAGPPIWGDEAFVADIFLTRDFAGLLRPLDYFQVASIGFLWAEEAASRILGASEWSLRLLPFLAGIASLVLFRRFARRAVDRRSALVAVGTFAASFYPVRHATEIKPYAVDLLLSLASTGLAWSLWKDRESTGRWLALAGTVAVGVWFSYPLVFVAAGLGMVLAFGAARSRSSKERTLCSAFGLAAASSWLAGYLLVGRGQAEAAPFYLGQHLWGIAFLPLSEPWRIPLWLLDVHTGNMLAYPIGGNHFGSLATAVLVAFGCVRLGRTRPALLAMLLGPLVPTLLASALRRYPYGTSARVSLYMAPAFCLLAGVGFVSLIRRFGPPSRRPRTLAIASTVLLAAMAVASVANVALPYKNFEDLENRRAVRELARASRPGDRWLVFDGLGGGPPRYDAVKEHWLQQLAEIRFHLLTHAPGPLRWITESDEVAPGAPGTTWLVVHRAGNPEFVEDRLAGCLARLADRLGSPKLHPRPLTRGESLDAYEFPTRGSAGSRP